MLVTNMLPRGVVQSLVCGDAHNAAGRGSSL